VQEALDRVMAGRTSVVIAHRLSTIRHSHVIALVSKGSILERGSHEELMKIAGGGYARLVAAQSSKGNGKNKGASTFGGISSTNNVTTSASKTHSVPGVADDE
jgi:ABC-type oligopeptide transport system ATPase subunit